MGSLHRITAGLGALVVSCFFASVLSAQTTGIKWPRDVKISASDKRDIVALAKLMGVHDPASVDVHLRDDCCRIAAVQGRAVANGPERRWSVALMIRNNWRESAGSAPLGDRLRKGRWIADDSPVQVWAEWRVRDGDWFVDVGRDGDRPSGPYADAELIVHALHRGEIVNGIAGQPSIPTLVEGRSYMLIKDPPWRSNASGSNFEIWVGNHVLTVRIVGEIVEAFALGGVEF